MKKLLKISIMAILSIFLVVTPVLSAVQYDYVTYYVMTSDQITLTWDSPSAEITMFDVYLLRVEWDEVVSKYTNVESTEYTLTLPRSGMYIFMVRSKTLLTTEEITDIDGMDRPSLLQFIQVYNITDIVGDVTDLTDQELREAIINAGKASTWAKSTTHGQVNDVDRGWWVFGYVAKPGPIIIGNVKEIEKWTIHKS